MKVQTLVTWPVVGLAFLSAVVLSILPITSRNSVFIAVLARPEMVLSTILNANDRWGLPAFVPYVLGNVGTWTAIIVAVVAGLRLVRNRTA